MVDAYPAVAACDACGWIVNGEQLPPGQSLMNALGSHAERDCEPYAARQYSGLDG